MKQCAIQDIHNFNEQIFNAIKEYLNDVNLYPTDSCLIINKKSLDVFIDNIIGTKECDIYPISSLTRLDENNSLEPDVDATFELSSKYRFAH
ncbi:MAG: hypothetical protein RR220_04495 [Bacteroidaceae bacterium]